MDFREIRQDEGFLAVLADVLAQNFLRIVRLPIANQGEGEGVHPANRIAVDFVEAARGIEDVGDEPVVDGNVNETGELIGIVPRSFD
jgi:hypothetical protein